MAEPTKWYQWMLLYPAILTSLGAAVPTAWNALKAWRLDVNYNKVQIAEEQKVLWERNLDCLEAKPVYSVEGPGGVVIGVTLCPSGDALLRYETEEHITYTWIRYPRKPISKQASGLPPGQARGKLWPPIQGPGRAWAQAEPPTPLLRSRIIWGATRCAMMRTIIVMRLFTTDGKRCWLEHVLSTSGVVLSHIPISCSLSCLELQGQARSPKP